MNNRNYFSIFWLATVAIFYSRTNVLSTQMINEYSVVIFQNNNQGKISKCTGMVFRSRTTNHVCSTGRSELTNRNPKIHNATDGAVQAQQY